MNCPELHAAWQRTTGGPAARSCGPYLKHARGCPACSAFARRQRRQRQLLRAAARAEDAVPLPEELVQSILAALRLPPA